MTIHLLRAPDYPATAYFAVCHLLQTMHLPGWGFVVPEVEIDPETVYPGWGGGRRSPETVQFAYHSPVEKVMYDADRGLPLSWRELFAVCQFYRQQERVPPSAVVVLLTHRPNALNWFSGFDDKQNVFIHTADWEQFLPCDPMYPVAYQVLSNALQLQVADAFGLTHKQDGMHPESIGCMNDLCQHKSQIGLKLRTGDICVTCLARLKAAEVPDVLVQAALAGFDQLRRQMLFRQTYLGAGQPGTHPAGPIRVNAQYRVLLPNQGNLMVPMSALVRTVYIFFLRHPEGIRLVDVVDHKAEITRLYERISGSGSQTTIQQSLERLFDPVENALHENLSRSRKALIDTLGATLAHPYLILGEAGERYRVGLPPELVQLEGQPHSI